MNSYVNFLRTKSVIDVPTGLDVIPDLNPMLFSHQADMVRWALRRGRAALFADCGLGKTPMELEWAYRQPHECIIVAPLAVAHQFVREAEKFGVDVAYAKDQSQVTKRITVTNYERLENFHIEQFGAVSLDESSILKNSSGAYCTWMIEAFKNTPFRLLPPLAIASIRESARQREQLRKDINERLSNSALAKAWGVHVRTIEKVLSYATGRHVL